MDGYTYDAWKLATPPEYERPAPPWEQDVDPDMGPLQPRRGPVDLDLGEVPDIDF